MGVDGQIAGQEYDADTGLYYYNARWYDAKTGRFTSPDPTGFAAGDVNLYRYVNNSVVNATDPSGLRPPFGSDDDPVFVPDPAGGDPYDPGYNDPGRFIPYPVDPFPDLPGQYPGFNLPPGFDGADPFDPTDPYFRGGINRTETIHSFWDDYDEERQREWDSLPTYRKALWMSNVPRFILVDGIARTALPPSEPTVVVRYGDGSRTYFDGGGPSGDDLAKQGAMLFPLTCPPRKLPSLGNGVRAPVKGLEKLSGPALKSFRSLQQRVAEHMKKLADYRANPDAFDNLGFLKNAPTSEIRQQIIERRIRHLEQEIKAFEDQMKRLLGDG